MSNCQNNCNNCYYRGNAIGSGHHATCNYPDMDEKTKIDISLLSMASFTSFNETLNSRVPLHDRSVDKYVATSQRREVATSRRRDIPTSQRRDIATS